MKPLTKEDLPVLASLIRWATHRRVDNFRSVLLILRNNKAVIQVKITCSGKALATDIIPGFIMKSYPHSKWPWEILI